MSKKITALFMTAFLLICTCVPVLAAETDSAGTVFAADDTVSLDSVPFFTSFACGQSVDITDSKAQGSIMAAGRDVSVGSTVVNESLYIAGEKVTSTGNEVSGNIFAAGNSIDIEESSANGVYAAGNEITFGGTSKGFWAAGTKITFSGKVDGDVVLEGDTVKVESGSVVTGELRIVSSKEPEVAEDTSIGSYKYEEIAEKDVSGLSLTGKVSIGSVIWSKVKSCVYWVIAMGVFGVILCWLFNSHLVKAAELIREKPGLMIGTGIISWCAIPVLAIFLCCSYVLAPVGGMLLLAYVLINCAGLAFAGASLARLFLPNMNIYLSAIIGIAVFEVLIMIPFIGILIGIVADMYLIAYVVQTIWTRVKNEKAARVAVVEEEQQ